MARRTGRRRVGEFTSQRGGALALRGFGAALVAVGLVYVAATKAHGDGRTIFYVLAAVAALVAWGSLRESSRWTRGAGGERRVARALRPLERRGWQIDHDVAKPRGGNVDHIALGPNGLFTIETKLNRFGKRELTQARGHAFATMRLGGRYPAAGAGLMRMRVVLMATREDRGMELIAVTLAVGSRHGAWHDGDSERWVGAVDAVAGAVLE